MDYREYFEDIDVKEKKVSTEQIKEKLDSIIPE